MTFNVQTRLFVCCTEPTAFETRSYYGKAPYSRAQHVGVSGAGSRNSQLYGLTSQASLSTAPHVFVVCSSLDRGTTVSNILRGLAGPSWIFHTVNIYHTCLIPLVTTYLRNLMLTTLVYGDASRVTERRTRGQQNSLATVDILAVDFDFGIRNIVRNIEPPVEINRK